MRGRMLRGMLSVVVMAALCAGSGRAGDCGAGWETGFTLQGIQGVVRAVTTFDDGGGRAVYIGGQFEYAGRTRVRNIVKWTAEHGYEALGEGVDDVGVFALCVYDDGDGEALYVGGQFESAGGSPASRIARWDGAQWEGLSASTVFPGHPSAVYALHATDLGDGEALYVGGTFWEINGLGARNLARYRGGQFELVDAALLQNRDVHMLASVVGAQGPELFVYSSSPPPSLGGYRFHRWVGGQWSTLPLLTSFDPVAIVGHDDGTGAAMYAGGMFETGGSVTARNVVRSRDGVWEVVGANALLSGQTIDSFLVVEEGGEDVLYAGGATHLRWDGASWTTIGGGAHVGSMLTRAPVGGTERLCAVARLVDERMIRPRVWDGAVWEAWSDGEDLGLTEGASALVTHVDSEGVAGVVAAGVTLPGANAHQGVRRWDGGAWATLPVGDNAYTARSALLAQSAGARGLYVGGNFTTAGGASALSVALHDGASWSSPGGGLTFAEPGAREVRAIAVYDDGTGPSLYVGGTFRDASPSGASARHGVARWDGTQWRALGEGTLGVVRALEVFDDGSGARLYAGGTFQRMGNARSWGIASWDGTVWHDTSLGVFGDVYAMGVWEGAGGALLYVGGSFQTTRSGAGVAAVETRGIVSWDGAEWRGLGRAPHVGVVGNGSVVRSIVVEERPESASGHTVLVGGSFRIAGAISTVGVARWDGAGWMRVGDGLGDGSRVVSAMTLGEGQEGEPWLYVSGTFVEIGGEASARFAAYRLCGSYCPADANGDRRIDFLDLNHVLSGFGEASTPGAARAGDLNGDGTVDFLDLNLVLSWFGVAC
ncbi:MAG: dockerin type I domain-containing protein [Phycisphaerales bacterium]